MEEFINLTLALGLGIGPLNFLQSAETEKACPSYREVFQKTSQPTLPKPTVKTLMKTIHQHDSSHTKYLIPNIRKWDNQQTHVAPPS